MQRYLYSYSGGRADLFVSKQDNGYFIGSLLYYKKSGSRAKGEEMIVNFIVQHFLDKSSDGIVKQAETWFKNNLSEEFTKQE